MDDEKFDDIIKGKVSDYEDVEFDPTSLASLHRQMAARSVVPWHVSRRSELITGSVIALSTILILTTQWYWNKQHAQMLTDEIISLKYDRQEFENMQKELDHWKSVQRDTIRIIEIRQEQTLEYTLLQQRINALEHEIHKLMERQIGVLPGEEFNQPEADDHLTEDSNNGLVNGQSYSRSGRLMPRSHDEISMRAVHEGVNEPKTIVSRNLSVKMIRDMDKHYQNGVGIKIGPVIEASNGLYSAGSGQFTVGYGVLADLILSPSLSLETGAKYFKRNYDVSEINELDNMSWPGADESLGVLQKAEVENTTLEIPLNLKYRYPVSLKTHWLATIGYSPTIYLSQLFEYEYAFDDGGGGNSFMIHSSYRNDKITLYAGTLNFSLGLSNQLKNRKILETSLFYQQGLGDMGVEKMRTKYFGVRGIYWFNVK